jgi:hypothetical protein
MKFKVEVIDEVYYIKSPKTGRYMSIHGYIDRVAYDSSQTKCAEFSLYEIKELYKSKIGLNSPLGSFLNENRKHMRIHKFYPINLSDPNLITKHRHFLTGTFKCRYL